MLRHVKEIEMVIKIDGSSIILHIDFQRISAGLQFDAETATIGDLNFLDAREVFARHIAFGIVDKEVPIDRQSVIRGVDARESNRDLIVIRHIVRDREHAGLFVEGDAGEMKFPPFIGLPVGTIMEGFFNENNR